MYAIGNEELSESQKYAKFKKPTKVLWFAMISGFNSTGPGPGIWLNTLACHSKPAALCHLQAVASGHSKASAAFHPASSMIVEPPHPQAGKPELPPGLGGCRHPPD